MRTKLFRYSGLAACVLLAAGVARAQDAELPKGAVARFGDGMFHCESIVLSPTGKVAALNGKGARPVFVDFATGKRLTQFDYLDNPLLNVFGAESGDAYAFSPDGKTVLAYLNRAMVLLNVETGKIVWRAAVDGRPRSVSLSRDGKRFACGFAGFETRTAAVIFDMEKGERIFSVAPVAQVDTEVALSDDGQLLAARGGESGRRLGPEPDSPFAGQVLQVWQVGTVKEKTRILADFPKHVRFAPDGKSIAYSTQSGITPGVIVYDLVAGKEKQAMEMPKVQNFIPIVLAYSPDGKKLACGDHYGRIAVWNSGTGEKISEHKAPVGNLRSLEFGDRFLACGKRNDQGLCWLYDVAAGKLLTPMAGNSGPIDSMIWSKDGKTLGTASMADRRICLWDRATSKVRAVDLDPAIPDDDFYWTNYMMSVSPDGKSATGFGGFGDYKLRTWDAATGKLAKETSLGKRNDQSFPFWSPDRSRFAVRSRKSLDIRDASGAPVAAFELDGNDGAANLEVAFSSDNKLVAAVLGKGIKAWDLAAKKVAWEEPTAKGHYGRNPLLFGSDGKNLFLVESSEPKIVVFDAATGKEKRRLTAGKTYIEAFAVSPKSNRIATAWHQGAKAVIEIFDGDAGRSLMQFASPQRGFRTLAFSPDDALLASGGWDTTVYLWDVAAK